MGSRYSVTNSVTSDSPVFDLGNTNASCDDSFIAVEFDKAFQQYSNLGGVGPDVRSPRGILITGVGSAPLALS